ncbi:MAG TPA: Gfo/Idh/MocA family oxidoreductase [Tepidisphaeraceae bacterium]|jgi:predicted dehydrogenase
MNTVRFGVIGLGNMGAYHCGYMHALENASLTAVCDSDAGKLDLVGGKHPEAKKYTSWEELMGSGEVDAVIVAVPHYEHPAITIAALERGLHVMTEKPEAVSINAARRMNEVAEQHPKQKFGIMFQTRTNPLYKKIRDLVLSGDLGEITRITWIATSWFRTWTYYASGGWRATWAGEGGGVLLNQCPHNLDQLYWLTGMMPSRITAVASIGKTHPIEVEDEVSAIMEYPGGAIGHFVTTTGEAPGTDRLEIVGDRGRIVSESGKLTMKLNRKSTRELREKSTESFPSAEAWEFEVPVKRDQPEGAKAMAQNFVNAILKDEELIAPGAEGIKGLEIGNAMMMAGLTRKAVDLPINGDAFDAFLKEMTTKYGGRKTAGAASAAEVNMGASFGSKAS